jgi:hypothetical protein
MGEKKNKINYSIIGAIAIILFLSLVVIFYPNLGDWITETITGRATATTDLNISIGTGGNSPQVVRIFDSGDITLNEGPSSTNISINFSVIDTEGDENLNDTAAQVFLNRTGQAERLNHTCDRIEASGNYTNYTCVVSIFWFDDDGPWSINANISDLASNTATNGTTTFSINTLTGFQLGPANVGFSNIAAGAVNTSADDNLTLNNTGNQVIADGSIKINSTNFVGEKTNTEKIYTGNITASNNSGSSAECDFPETATQMNESAGSVYQAVSGANLSFGNYTANDDTAREIIFICITQTGGELSQQSYSTLSEGAWTVQIT